MWDKIYWNFAGDRITCMQVIVNLRKCNRWTYTQNAQIGFLGIFWDYKQIPVLSVFRTPFLFPPLLYLYLYGLFYYFYLFNLWELNSENILEERNFPAVPLIRLKKNVPSNHYRKLSAVWYILPSLLKQFGNLIGSQLCTRALWVAYHQQTCISSSRLGLIFLFLCFSASDQE